MNALRRGSSLAIPAFALLLAAALALLAGVGAPPGAATLSPANGQGSTYATLAFQEWTQSVQTRD